MTDDIDRSAVLYHHAPIGLVIVAGILFALGLTVGMVAWGAAAFGVLVLCAILVQYTQGEESVTATEIEMHNVASGQTVALFGILAAVAALSVVAAERLALLSWQPWMTATGFLIALIVTVYGLLSLYATQTDQRV